VIPLRLRVESAGGEGYEVACERGTLVVGRARDADLFLADTHVSRRHAQVVCRDDAWWAEDLGARNGTFLNGQPLAAATRLALGDVLSIGRTSLRVVALGEARLNGWGEPMTTEAVGGDIGATVLRRVEIDRALGSDTGTGDIVAADLTVRLRLLNEVHRALATTQSLDELLRLILDRAFAAFGPEEGAIFLCRPDGSVVRAAERRPPGAAGDPMASRSLLEEVAIKGAAALVLDASADARFAQAASIVGTGLRSIVAAPLLDDRGSLGMIALGSRLGARRFSEQDLELLTSLASAAALRVRNLALAEEAAARRLLEHELALAHDMQMAMLAPRALRLRRLDLVAHLRPARSVGGDFYDYVVVGDRVWFIVGDVAGKGVEAALFMAVARTLFRAHVHAAGSAAALLARMNDDLARDNDRAMFVTACAGWVDAATGIGQVANAGHPPPLRRCGDVGVDVVDSPRAMPLGVRAGQVAVDADFVVAPDQPVVVFTDGVSEASNAEGERFGVARVAAAMAGDLAAHDATTTLGAVLGSLRAFKGTAPQDDDEALLVIAVTPGETASSGGKS